MCGRFTLEKLPALLLRFLGYEVPPPEPRYNITPTQPVLAVLHDRQGGGMALQALHWGLVPFWAKDGKMAARLINARSETAADKPSFRAALRYRRCLIPADGFYEWKKRGSEREPYYFTPADPECPLVMAGLWEDWEGGGAFLRSATILTAAANADMASVHDRMPVILPPEAWRDWLAPELQRADEVLALLRPCPEGFLTRRRVDAAVGSAFASGKQLIEPVADYL